MNEIQNKIINNCGTDISQKEVIISSKNKMLVEAPAGYGKTRTLLYKCIYMLSEKLELNYNKKFLILTFTNNGISRLKKDLTSELNKLGLSNKEKKKIISRIDILNFHTLGKRILSKYGYKINENLKEIFNFEFLSKYNLRNKIFDEMSYLIENRESDLINKKKSVYLNELESYINSKKLPYDGIFFLLLDLIKKYPEIIKFYRSYYENVFIDEFQDSNILAVRMINGLFYDREKKNRYYFGDSLQTIFEFSGADPDRFNEYKNDDFQNFYFELNNNYRFKDNDNLKQLEKQFRNYYNNIENDYQVNLDLNIFKNEIEEKNYILEKCFYYNRIGEKTAILIGNKYGNIIKPSNNINLLNSDIFFNGLFDDESDDDKYFSFCEDCLRIYTNFKLNDKFNLKNFYNFFLDNYQIKRYPFEKNYLILFEKFIFNYLIKEVYFLEREEVFYETLKKYQLIKYVEYIEDKIPIISIHKSKGLEWDNILIINSNKGILGGNLNSSNKEDLRLFYVAITRAKKQILFSMNKTYHKYKVGTGLKSDLFNLPFLKVNELN